LISGCATPGSSNSAMSTESIIRCAALGTGGALIGALIVAGAEVLLIYYVDPLLSDVVPFLVLVAMLFVRPWGLFGTREELDRV